MQPHNGTRSPLSAVTAFRAAGMVALALALWLTIAPPPAHAAFVALEPTAGYFPGPGSSTWASSSSRSDLAVQPLLAPILSITKTARASELIAGDGPVQFSILVHNAGSLATNVRVDDIPDPALDLLSLTPGPVGSMVCYATYCIISTLPSGGTAEIVALVQTPASTAVGTYTNTAYIFSAGLSAQAPVEVVAQADLTVDKTGPATATAGDLLDYTLTVHNNGPSDAQNVIVTDTLPAGVVALTPLTFNWGALPADVTVIVHVVGRSDAGTCYEGQAVNTVDVAAGTPDPNPTNNAATWGTTVTTIGWADLQIEKQPLAASVTAGEDLSYAITVTNEGPGCAGDVGVLDLVPAGTHVVTMTADNPYSGDEFCSLNGTCELGTLPYGVITDGGTISLANGTPGTARNNTLNRAVVVGPGDLPPGVTITDANLAVEFSHIGGEDCAAGHDGTPPWNSEMVLYLTSPSGTRVVLVENSTNWGGSGLGATYWNNSFYGGLVTVAFDDAAAALLGGYPQSGRFRPIQPLSALNGQSPFGTWTLTAGDYLQEQVLCFSSYTLTLTAEKFIGTPARIDLVLGVGPDYAGNTLVNQAQVAGDTDDADETNNVDTVTTTVQFESALAITKTALADRLVAGGEPVEFSILVRNGGPSDARDLLVTDELDPRLTLLSLTPGPAVPMACGTVSCTVPVLPAGSTAEIMALVSAPASKEAGAYYNRACIPGLPCAEAPIQVVTEADLAIDKTGPATATAGDLLTYTVAVHNSGPSYAQDVQVADILPYSVLPVAGYPLTFNLGGLAPGQTVVLEVVGRSDPTACYDGKVNNTVEATTSTPDPDPTNNSDAWGTVILGRADLQIEKEALAASVTAGQALAYAITVTNAGPGCAGDVEVLDLVPPGTHVVGMSADNPYSEDEFCSLNGTCDLGTLPGAAAVALDLVDNTPGQANGDTNVTRTVTIGPGDLPPGTTVVDVDVAVDFDKIGGQDCTFGHPPGSVPHNEEIGFYLTSPGGTRVLLVDSISNWGGSGAPSYTDKLTYGGQVSVTFDDAAPTGVGVSPAYPASGSFRPEQPLSALNGESPFGMWTLVVHDDRLPSQESVLCYSGFSLKLTTDAVTSTQAKVDLVLGVDPGYDEPLLLNEVQVSARSGEIDPDETNNIDSAATAVDVAADLSVSKSVIKDNICLGSYGFYEVVVTNAGPSDASSVVMVDQLPGELIYGGGSPECGELNNTVTCQVGTLAAGESADLLIGFNIDGDVTGGTSIINTAAVSSTAPDPNPRNNTSVPAWFTAMQCSLPEADMHIEKVVTPDPVTPGQATSIVITLRNDGPHDAEGVIVQDRLLFNDQVTGFDLPDGWSCDGGITCARMNAMPSGAVETLTFAVYTEPGRQPGSYTNDAFVTADNPDSDLSDNMAYYQFQVVAEADLGIQKSVIKDEICLGAYGFYELLVTNNGPSDAQNVVITDTLPGELIYGGGSAECSEQEGTVTCSVDKLTAGESTDFLIGFNIASDVTGGTAITNTAAVGSETPEPAGAALPNTDDAMFTTVQCGLPEANLQIVKTMDPGWVVAGETIQVALEVTNLGPHEAQGVVLQDRLLFGGQVTAFELPAQWSCDSGVTCVRQGPMPPNSPETLYLTIRVPADTQPGAYENTAFVTADNPDPVPDNTATVWYDVIARSALSIYKNALAEHLVAGGEPGQFSILVTNAGPSDAHDVPVLDQPSAGLELLALTPGPALPMTCSADRCTIDTLPAGDTAEIYALVRAPAGTPAETYTNTACTGMGGNGVVFDGVSGRGAPPAALGPYTMTPFPADGRPEGALVTSVTGPTGNITFASGALHQVAGSTWPGTWGHGYSGDVYAFGNVGITGILLPPGTRAFYFYAHTIDVAALGIMAGAQDGTMGGPIWIDRDDAAGYFGFYALGNTTLQSIMIFTSGGYLGLGQFGITVEQSALPICGAAPIPVVARADLALHKTATPTANAGEWITYTLAVQNSGPSDAAGVTIVDTLPPGVVLSGASAGCAPGPDSTVECDVGTLAASAQSAITVVVSVDSALEPGTSLENTATVTATTPEINPLDNTDTADTSIVGLAGLSLDKQAPASVIAGESMIYTLTVHNAGPSTAQSVVVADALPGGVTFVSASFVKGGDGPVGCGGPTCLVGDLAAGATATVTLGGAVDPGLAAGTALTNTATVVSDTPEDNAQDNADWATTVVQTAADLAVDKVDLEDPVEPLEGYLYQVNVANRGPSDARDVVVVDTLGPGVTFSTASPDCTGTPGDPTVTCTLDGLEAGERTFFLLAVTAGDVPSGTVLLNDVTVSGATTDPDGTNDADRETTAVRSDFGPSADLAIEKTARPDQVPAGGLVTYVLTVTNAGPLPATGVQVLELIPVDTELVSIVADNPDFGYEFCTLAGICYLGTVYPHTTVARITAVLRVDPGCQATSLTNIASVSANQADYHPDDNLASAEVQVSPRTVADLVLDKDATPTAGAGGIITYTLAVRNLGPQPAAGVRVTDTLPAGVTLTAADAACTPAAGGAVCATPLLEAGQVVTFTLIGSVDAGIEPGTSLENRAVAGSPAIDPNPSDNTDTADTSIVGGTDLELSKTGPEWVTHQRLVTYTIVVTNYGPSLAQSVDVKDDLPAGIDLVSAAVERTGEGPALCGGLVCQVGDMAVGERITVTVVGRAQDGLARRTVLTNTATVFSDTPEDDLSNNTDDHAVWVRSFDIYLPHGQRDVDVVVPLPDLVGSFTLTPDKAQYRSDEQVVINVTVTNQGTVAAEPFWVDFYLNPSPVPTGPNLIWDAACSLSPCYGLTWLVSAGLAPGASVTLTSTPGSYDEARSLWTGSFAVGTTDLYLYVDSRSAGASTGAVPESDEWNNRAERHGLTVTGALHAVPE